MIIPAYCRHLEQSMDKLGLSPQDKEEIKVIWVDDPFYIMIHLKLLHFENKISESQLEEQLSYFPGGEKN